MKRIVFSLSLILATIMMQAQTVEQRLKSVEDKIALKELVDEFSILSDQKDGEIQALLFTENAVVKTYLGDKCILTLKGRKQIGDTFGNFLKSQETVYHINGQQTVKVDGDKATGISYCQVTLIANTNGKHTQTMQGVYYNDEYVRVNGKWLINKRDSHFQWRETKIIE